MEDNKQRNLILQLAGMTIIGMPLVASIIDWFADSFVLGQRLMMGSSFLIQIPLGVALGFGIGYMAQWIVERNFMHEVNIKYSSLIDELQLGTSEIIFISLCAGVGEEILFRGALQPLAIGWMGDHLGIWVTSLVFVGIHGYINPKDWRITVYGLFMTVAIAGLGYLTELVGIWTAIGAHTFIDYYLLSKVIKNKSNA